jgi:tetratricopeptide (TPR) repeat protein
MAVRCKTFDVYLRELILHPERAKKWMKDRRLTIAEKKILNSHLMLRDNKYIEAIKELQSVSNIDIEFVNDHKHLLLGICYNNTGKYAEGYDYLKKAAKGFQEDSQSYHLFTTLFNLINNLGNLGRVPEMRDIIQKMEELSISGKLQEIRLLRSQFIYASESNNFPESQILLPKIHKLKGQMPESELGAQLICEFIFHIKIEDFDSAKMVLAQMKHHRKFMVSENFHFMNKLLNHLQTDDTLYIYEREFPSPESVLFRQIKVIEALHAQELDEASKHWSFLQEKYGKTVYRDDFKWSGEKCLFSLCLEKHLNKPKVGKDVLKIVAGDGPKYQMAYEVLKNAQTPVRSEELYEILYGELIESKDDLRKLALLMINIRKHYAVQIISRKGTYELVSKETIAKASSN